MTRPVVDELYRARVALADLLWGRLFRERAALSFGQALRLEAMGSIPELIDSTLALAAQFELIARQTETGNVLWGDRYNRDGHHPGDFE